MIGADVGRQPLVGAVPGERRFDRRRIAQHGKMFLDRRRGHALAEQAVAQAARIVGQQHLAGLGLEECAVMARAVLLSPSGFCERAAERLRMRPRQDGERGEPLGMRAGHAPRDLPAPIVADQMEALAVVARGRGDLEGVGHQLVEGVVGRAPPDRAARPANSRAGRARRRDSPPRRAPAVPRASCAANSGKPCSSSTSGPPAGPATSAVNVRPDRVLMPCCLDQADQVTPLALNQASAFFQPSSAGSLR